MKNFRLTKKNKDLLIKIVSAVAIVAAVIGCVSLVTQLTKEAASDYKTFKPAYSIGAIDDVTGKKSDNECALYTPDIIECTGIELYADFDSDIDYCVYYYDENDAYISCTPNEALNLKIEEFPEGTVGVRIAIYPNNDSNDKIGIFERGTYANQLTVKITTVEVEESDT